MTRKNRAIRLSNEGNILYRKEQYELATECYTKAIELHPGNSAFYGNRGQSYFRREMFEESVSDSLRAVKLDGTYWKGYIRAGKGMVKLGRLDEAASFFQEVAKYKTDDNEAAVVSEFEVARVRNLVSEVEIIKNDFDNKNYIQVVNLINQLEDTIPQSFLLKSILCDCQYQRKQYAAVLKTTNSMKKDMQLDRSELQHVTATEMKAFASLSLERNKLSLVDGIIPNMKSTAVNKNTESICLYEVLGVDRESSVNDIARAYTTLALKYHPERQPNYVSVAEKEVLKSQFLKITHAFVILSDSSLRELYDDGFSESDIINEDIDPVLVFCNAVPTPPDASLFDRLTYSAKKSLFWLCSPVIATATCPCWGGYYVKRKLSKDDETSWYEEQRFKWVATRRDKMREMMKKTS